MVRETRHLWVGNLPENIREDRIREHFKRYGRVQSVKLLPRGKEDEASTGLSATVAFMDLKSASKAHNMEQKLDERSLSTEYYEPPIPGSASAPLYAAPPPRFPHGVPEEHVAFDRTSLFYDRSGSGDAYLRRGPPAGAGGGGGGGGGYHVPAGDPMRGRGGRDRIYRNGPLPHPQFIDRPPPPHHRPPVTNAWNYETPPSVRYPVVPAVVEPAYPEERREPPPVVHKKRPKSRSGSESGSNTVSSRSRSRSRSSSSSTNSRSSSGSSGTSSAVEGSPHSSRTARSGRAGGATVQSTVSAPHTNNSSPAVHSEDRRPLAICVRNLPIRSSDTSLKDGLFHEYKKHGKVTWVKVVGQGTDRYALVCFKKPEDVEKALEVSHDKLFFGCKIEVASYQGYDVDDNESRPYEAELDEYHPKATRTLFIGNLEKDVTASELRKQFEQFGEIIEIDIKKQGAVSSYAFCQYADIASVVKAMRTMDGEHLGNNRIKLGFGKSMPTNCVWVDGVADTVSEKYLNAQFNPFGSISHVTIDRERGHALIYFEQIPYAQEAVRDMRGVAQRGRKLQVDFASRECQETFYEHLEKQGHAVVGGERPWDRYDNNREVQASRFEVAAAVPGARFPRYEVGAAPRPRPPAAGYVRTANNATVVASPAPGTVPPPGLTRASPRGGARLPGQRYAEYFDSAEYPERRYSRNYDEVSPGSPASHEDAFDHGDYGYCPRTSPTPAGTERSVAVVIDKALPEDEGYKRLQSVVVSDQVISPPLPPPPDMRHLQKERVHLLEQLEECPSSGDDDVAPKKRPKVVDCAEPGMSNNTSNCFDSANHEPPLLLVTTHNHRKSISEIRRLSDASLKHCSRRPSADGLSSRPAMDMPSSYAPHMVCKRRKTGSSASEGEDRAGGCGRRHGHHHHHHSGELESMDGSRPGTPLCDERPENLLPPSEPRRPRERAAEGPLSLPLPRFASQVLTARVLAGKPIIASPPNITSPRIPVAHPPPSPSPTQAPPPSSPPPRPPSLPSSSSSDSEMGPPSPTLEERIRSLDEKYEKWSGSRNIQAPSETIAKLDAAGDRFRFRHKLLDLNELKPSDIVKSVLAKPSVFDEDSKRLENVGDKYEPKEFVPFKGAGCFQSLRIKTECGTTPPANNNNPPSATAVSFPSPAIPPRLVNMPSPLHSPNQPSHKSSPFSTGAPTTAPAVPKALPVMSPGASPTSSLPPPGKAASIPKTGALSPRAAGPGIPAAKGLQYPFPSHPPVVPTTSVATTTASATNVIALVSVSVTTASVSVFNAEVPRTCAAVKPVGVPALHQHDPRSRVAPTAVTITAATATKPTPEVVCRIQVPQQIASYPPVSMSKVQTNPLNSRHSACVKPQPAVTLPPTISSTEVTLRASPVKHLSSATCSDDAAARLPSVSSFPAQPIASGPTTLSTPLGPAKKPCATTVAPSLPPRITTAGITRSVTTTPDVPTSSTSSVPSSPRLAASKSTDISPKILNSLPARHAESMPPNANIPPAITACDVSALVSLVCSPTVATTSVVTAVTPTTTSTTAVLTVTVPTAAVATTASLITNTSVTLAEQSKHSQKPKSVSNLKVQASSNRKESTPSFPIKKEKEDSKITSSHRSKSLEEKKDKKESTAAVCQRRESEGVDRRADKDKRRDKDTSDAWDSKRKDKELESERRKEWEPSENEREKKKECVDIEKDRRKENLNTDRIVCSDKDASDKAEKEKSGENESSDILQKKKDFSDERCKESHPLENIVKERWKDKEGHADKEKRRENHIDHSRDKDLTEPRVHVADISTRKDSEPTELLDRRKSPEQPNEPSDRRKEKDLSETAQRRKSTDGGSEKRKSRDSPESVDRRKDREQNHVDKRKEPVEVAVEKKKELDSVEPAERRKEREGEAEEKRKERRRERSSSVQSPAPIGSKRRISSQDSQENDEAKRPKLAERRDSKDSGRSSGSSSKRGTHHSFAKPHDDKTKHEAERKRHDHDKSRDRPKKKNRDAPKTGKETVDDRETSTSPRLLKRKEDSDSEDKEEVKHRHSKKETVEKKKATKEDSAAPDLCEDKARSTKKDREKRGSSEKRKEDTQSPAAKDDPKPVKKESRIHKMSNSDTDSDDEDGPKKHSIFDIVDDGPAYISMYDKVKARSTKNMQKQEEEKRQEKMREKFSLLKASRAKREEKKRSTSWDEDSDSDMDPELRRAKRAGKPVISSSSEDESSRRRPSYDADDAKSVKSGGVKKDDLGLGDSDSDSHHRGLKPVNRQHDDEGNSVKHLMSVMRKGSRAKLLSDTSDDDVHAMPYKGNHLTEMYSAESDADQGFADVDDRHPSLKKSSVKNHKLNKSVMDSLSEESIRKPIPDISKCTKEKNTSHKKSISKNKTSKGVDWSDEEKGKIVAESGKADLFDEEKLAAIFKPKVNNKIKPVKTAFNSSDEEHTRKILTDAVKAEIFGDDKSANFTKKSVNRMKTIKRCLDSSDDDLTRKHLSSTPKMDIKAAIKNKCIKNSPDSFDEESHHDKVAMFGEITPNDKYTSHKNMVQTSFTEVEHILITPPQLDKKSSFFANSTEKSVDSGRKKTHKKKQKRIRDLQSGTEGSTKVREVTENHSDSKVKSEKKHKRERRKSDHGEDHNKVNKVHKKKSLKQDVAVPVKPENSVKRDEKMEDIFGPISDDSESSISTIGKVLPPLHNNGGRVMDKLPSKWQVSMIYGSDSDSIERITPSIVTPPVRPTEKERKRRDKKRRDRKAREEDSAGAELAEAGRVLEAKLMGTNNYMAMDTIKREPSEDDGTRFNDDDANLEPAPVLQEKSKDKEKKKKRKKSKEEKQNKHHHHHHHEKSNKSMVEGKSTGSEDTSFPLLQSPFLPTLDIIQSDVTPKVTPVMLTVTPPSANIMSCKISPRSMDKKKTDKFIPGFGVPMDAAVHETAVKSISEFEAAKPQAPPKTEVTKKTSGSTPKEGDDTEGDEEKPRAAISQEETEDAVAALLGESFGADFADCYGNDGNGSPHHAGSGTNLPQLQTDEEEETRQAVEGLIDMKPDTPQSEPDLQIDTDTDDDNDGFLGLGFSSRDDNRSRSSDNIDFSKPPKTPDMPASYYRQQKPEAELPAVVKAPATPEPLPIPPTYPKPIPLKEEPQERSSPKPVAIPTPISEDFAKQSSRVVEEPKKEFLTVIKDEPADTVDIDIPKLVGLIPVEAPKKPILPPTVVVEKTAIPTIEKPAVFVKTEVEPNVTLPIVETLRESLPTPTPTVIKAPSPTPIKVPNSLSLESVIKCQEPRKEETIKERAPLSDNVKEFKPYSFVDSVTKKDSAPTKDDTKLVNNIDFGRLEKARPTDPDAVNQEDDFSEPETDLKSDSDFVTNLLKSDSLTRGMSIDDNTPDAEKAESSFEPFREKNVEAVSVIKEVDPHQAKLEQFASQKPPTSGKENHVDFIRADTGGGGGGGFWSTKEVNIDSVIKKVDALCSAEEDLPGPQPWFASVKEEAVKPHEVPTTEPKLDIPKAIEEIKPAAALPEVVPPILATVQKEADNLEVPAEAVQPMRARSEDRLSTMEADRLLTPDPDAQLQSGSSPEDDQSEATTPRSTQKGRRGIGGRRKVASRVANNVTTRRTRLGQKTPEGAASVAGASPVSPRRGGRPAKGANRNLDPSLANRNKLPADVYEFHDDSEDESGNGGGGDKNRPRLILTIKSPVPGAAVVANSGEPPPAVAAAAAAAVAGTSKVAEPVKAAAEAVVAAEPAVKAAEVVKAAAAEPPKAAEIVNVAEPIKAVEAPVKTTETVKAAEAGKAADTSKAAETVEEAAATPAANTRKSRRLQVNNERDGSRSTVDDTIEDVVRGAAPLTRAAAANLAASTKRLGKQPPNTVPPTPSLRAGTQPLEPRKSPRGGKRPTQQRTSESQDESDGKGGKPDELPTPTKPVETPAAKEAETKPEVAAAAKEALDAATEPALAVPTGKPVAVIPPGMMLKPRVPGESEEPMTLIDPVTGLLIPMRESEEGQYIPVTSAAGRALAESVDSGTVPLAGRVRVPGLAPGVPAVQVPVISKSPVLPLPAAKPAEVKAVPIVKPPVLQPTVVQPPTLAKTTPAPAIPQPAKMPTPVSAPTQPVNLQVQAKPQASGQPLKNAIQPQIKVTHPPVGTTYPPNKLQMPPKGAVAPTALHPKVPQHLQGPQIPNSPKPHLQGPQMPNSPKPHLQGPPLANSPKPHLQGPPLANSPKPHLQGPQMPNSPKPHLQGPPVPNSPKPHLQGPQMPNSPKPHLQGPQMPNSPKPHLQGPQIPNSPKPQGLPMPNSPKPHYQGPPQMPNSPKPPPPHFQGPPLAQHSPKGHHLQAGSLKPQQAVSPASQTAMSAHLPQQAHMNKVMLQHPGVVANLAPGQKGHMLQAPRPASPAVHATASPPKAHQGLGPPPILTGAVASPPLKASQQPVVTGASSSRVAVPKAQVPNLPGQHLSPHGKNVMIPPKVEVSMGGCIVVPSASPQPRGQVMQAGMPVPAYEASLGDVVQHVFPHSLRASHDMAQHYVHPSLMYQQYYRAAHIPYHLVPGGVRSPMMPGMDAKLEAESDEARGSSPPLEHRRPPSSSLQSPHDRLTDSPQVATVYMHGSRMPHYTPRYYEAEPPPAHVRSAPRHHPLPGTEAPSTQPMLQVATPPHASQVPPQADSLLMLLQRYPVMWQGLLALKNDQAAVQMHFVFGNSQVARDSLPCNSDGSTAPLRIAQRMRLEQTQVEGVARKMQMDNEHCMLLALPCGRDHMDVLQQSNNLQTGFITYLQQKQAAGIVNIAAPGSQQAAYVVHIFPSCDFANENLARIAPDLLHRVADIAHLLIIIATV